MNKLTQYCLAILIGLPLLAGSEAAAQGVNREYKLKAVYLYHFCSLTEWPAPTSESRPLVIGILGSYPFEHDGGDYLRAIARDKRIGGRRLRVVELDDDDEINCDLLFIRNHPRASQKLAAARAKIKTGHVLIVTESKGLAARGAMINFEKQGNRLQLELNPTAFSRANLTLPKQIDDLSNAKKVRESPDVTRAAEGRK